MAEFVILSETKNRVLPRFETLKAIQDIWHHIKKHRLGIGTVLDFLRDYFGG